MLSSSLARCSASGPRIPSALLAFSRRYVTKPSARPLLGRYDHVPLDLARVQSGKNVKLRDYEEQKALKRFSYDLKVSPDGFVLPAKGDNFIGPNGCSLRPPNSPTFQEVVRNFRGANILVYVLKEGTPLPDSLTILHEHSDHYSLQCTKPMKLDDLNNELTEFINAHGRTLDKEQFDEEYPFSLDF
ncbi:hypothetical protein DAEQUDRAFT_723681 [Daedalea quercina L-15889]|uniref:Tse2 ADP-ribosyltransferase toxin domain-containing protein n=1 Tax=Daedalea quercina L-15889 TaxID=1314783 RepID=A0A165SI36_9APHY|nr:hypothetical protein DAEQUDRAFT_723681 [Daedalea quercina L-15889]